MAPCYRPLDHADTVEEFAETVAETQCDILDEREIAACLPRAFKLAGVFVAGAVIVHGGEMGRDRRNAGCDEYLELDDPRGPPVPVAEGPYPREVEVGERRPDDGVGDPEPLAGGESGAVHPFAETVQQVSAVFRGCALISADLRGTVAEYAGNRIVPARKTEQRKTVDRLNPRRAQFGAAPLGGVRDDKPEDLDKRVDLLREIPARRGKFERMAEMAQYLVRGERVSREGGGCVRAPGEGEPVKRLRGIGRKRRMGDLLAYRLAFAERDPEPGRDRAEVRRKGEPRVCRKICPFVCHGPCHMVVCVN